MHHEYIYTSLFQISTYISGDAKDVPLLVLGGPGSGKSSILAKVADITEQDAFEKKLPKYDGMQHF